MASPSQSVFEKMRGFRRARKTFAPTRPVTNWAKVSLSADESKPAIYVARDEFVQRTGVPIEAVEALIKTGELPHMILPDGHVRINWIKGIHALETLEQGKTDQV